jgi:hypothetical protein
MHAIIETDIYLKHVHENGLTIEEQEEIVSIIAADPTTGDLITGTGGARKIRIAGRGKGKSGGYRVIHYYAADDVPIFLLALYSKGVQANLTKAQRNALAATLPKIAEDYRKTTAAKILRLRKEQPQ